MALTNNTTNTRKNMGRRPAQGGGREPAMGGMYGPQQAAQAYGSAMLNSPMRAGMRTMPGMVKPGGAAIGGMPQILPDQMGGMKPGGAPLQGDWGQIRPQPGYGGFGAGGGQMARFGGGGGMQPQVGGWGGGQQQQVANPMQLMALRQMLAQLMAARQGGGGMGGMIGAQPYGGGAGAGPMMSYGGGGGGMGGLW